MMVIQGESAENYNIILHKNSRGPGIEKIPFVEETKDLGLIDYGVNLLEKLIDKKILAVFKHDLLQNKVAYNLDKLSKYKIENIANNELDKINPNILNQGFALSPKSLSKFLQENQKISIIEIDSNSKTLGSCDIKNSIIGINKLVKNTNRELFILSHEYGHFALHQKLLIGQELYDNFIDSEYNFRTAKHELKNPKHWIEWQANYFASSLVLPKAPFLAVVWKCQNMLGMSNGKIFLDDQYQNRNKFIELVKRLAYLFNVSKTTVIYKLSELELINEQSRLKSIGQIISEYRDGLFT